MLNLQGCNLFSQRKNSTSFPVCARKLKLLLFDEILVLLVHQKLYWHCKKDTMAFISAISFTPVICKEQCHTSQHRKRNSEFVLTRSRTSLDYSFFTEALFSLLTL